MKNLISYQRISDSILVCPHAGGVGLCQMVAHIIMLDYIAISGRAHGTRSLIRRTKPAIRKLLQRIKAIKSC